MKIKILTLVIILVFLGFYFKNIKENLTDSPLAQYLSIVSPGKLSNMKESRKIPASCTFKYTNGSGEYGNQWAALINDKTQYFCIPKDPSNYSMVAPTGFGSTGSTGSGPRNSENCFLEKTCIGPTGTGSTGPGFGCCFDGITCKTDTYGSNCQTCPIEKRDASGCCSYANCEKGCCSDGLTCQEEGKECPSVVVPNSTDFQYTECSPYNDKETYDINDPGNVKHFNEKCKDLSSTSKLIQFAPRNCRRPKTSRGACSITAPKKLYWLKDS